MFYTGTFDDVHGALLDVLLHREAFGISLVSVTINQNTLVIETMGEIPVGELDHLGLEVV